MGSPRARRWASAVLFTLLFSLLSRGAAAQTTLFTLPGDSPLDFFGTSVASLG